MARTVTDSTSYGPNTEMSMLGYLIGAAALLVMLPLLPFIALLVVLLWLLGRLRPEEVSTSTPE